MVTRPEVVTRPGVFVRGGVNLSLVFGERGCGGVRIISRLLSRDWPILLTPRHGNENSPNTGKSLVLFPVSGVMTTPPIRVRVRVRVRVKVKVRDSVKVS